MYNKFITKSIKDINGNPLYINNNDIFPASSIYLDESIPIDNDFLGLKKGEIIPRGYNITDVLNFFIKSSTRKNTDYYTKLEKLTDYLYYLEYDNYDWRYAEEFLKCRQSPEFGACSSFRNGNFYGRNYDWYYDNWIDFVIKIPAKLGRHASVGGTNSRWITKDQIESGEFNPKFAILPFSTIDGINDAGVVMNCNVCPLDKGFTYGTNPNSKKNLHTFMIGRYILDNFSTAKDAVESLKEFNIYNSRNFGYELHYMVADKNDTYIVEFIRNKLVINKVNDRPYMTNFHITDTQLTSDGHIDYNTVEDYGCGLERYNILIDNAKSAIDEQSTLEVMKKIKYTNAYNFDVEIPWKTEVCANYSDYGLDLKVTTPIEKFKPVFEIAKKQFEERSRETAQTWYTSRCCVFDIENRSMSMWSEENYENKFSYTV